MWSDGRRHNCDESLGDGEVIFLFIWKINSSTLSVINKHWRTSSYNMKTERHQGNTLTGASVKTGCGCMLPVVAGAVKS